MNAGTPGLETKSSALATFLSLFCPGLGQIYTGRIVRGVAMLAITLILYSGAWLVFRMWQDDIRLHGILLEAKTSRGLPFDTAWRELEPVRTTNQQEFFVAVAGFAIALVWWTWGMVDARKLCEAHNVQVLELSTGVPRERLRR
jgi:hypothetical protein